MIGEVVEHPLYGQGKIVAVYRNGEDWLVRFENGLRFRRPRREFAGQDTITLSPAAPLTLPDVDPMPPAQFEARQLLEALRVGVAPAQHVKELTIGLEAERTRLMAGLDEAHKHGGSALAVIGEYGFGKTHIVELTSQEALERNFLVATASLDLGELPAHRGFAIYRTLMRDLRYPDDDRRGLEPLLEKAGEMPQVEERLRNATPMEHDPLATGLHAINNTPSSRQRKAWRQWLMGGRRAKSMSKGTPKGVKFPTIYKVGNNARQMGYLLSGVSVLARLVGYSGVCVLIDEAESYSLLYPYQRPKAGLFFSAVIYASMQEQQSRISADMLPQQRWRDYPAAYTGQQSLYFLFTITHSDQRMPIDNWLDEDRIMALDPHYSAQEIGQFMEQVMDYHAAAYGYEAGKRQRQVRRAAAEHLALGMRNGRLSVRGMVRLTVELFDLLHLYPDYEVTALLDELRQQVR